MTDFIFLGSRITADGGCSHEIKRHLLLGRKAMTNLDSILKSRDSTLATKFRLVKAMVFPVVMYIIIQYHHVLAPISPRCGQELLPGGYCVFLPCCFLCSALQNFYGNRRDCTFILCFLYPIPRIKQGALLSLLENNI